MALDEALMESVRQGAPPVLRFYRWEPACLSLGRNQPAKDYYDLPALERRGIQVVRRPTGGRAVLHHRELTYAVVVREGELGSPRECYAALNRALVVGLRRLGVAAALQPPSAARAPLPSLLPCFREPTEGEVVAGGRKLIGSAQYREEGVILQHGSLLLEGDQREVREFLRAQEECEEPPPPATLREFCDPLPSWETLAAALRAGWEEELGVSVEPGELGEAEQARARELSWRYADLAWTWRC